MKKLMFLAVLALVATGALSLAGAGTAAKPASASSTPRAANVLAGTNGFVRQVGLRNYAGPNCPGKGWNCTTATRVVQIATASGTNVGVCTGDSVVVTGNTQTCTISQNGANNTAKCTESSSNPTAVQICTITQNGTNNYATVNQSITQSTTATQSGKQTAEVHQGNITPTTGTNQLQLNQNTNQTIKTGTTQNQVAGQSVVLDQTATDAGTNYAGLTQSQLQKEYARSTLQNQNVSTTIDDCDPDNPPSLPNTCAAVVQTSDAGKNETHLRQSVSEDENSIGAATQRQGSADGGLDGRVHQETVSASSINDANQSKTQTQTAPKGPGSSQSQYDPISCCGFASQLGGIGNTDRINQSSTLSASGPNPFQSLDLIGRTHHEPDDGSCAITQKGSINIDSTNNSASYPVCPEFLSLETSCTGGFIVEGPPPGCTAGEPDTTPPPGFNGEPESSLSKCVQNVTEEGSCSSSVPASTGDTLQYDITYSNVGDAPGHSVTVTDVLPEGMSFVSCEPAHKTTASCNYNPETNTVTFNVGYVDPGHSWVMSFRTEVDSIADCSTVSNVAEGSAQEESESVSSYPPADVTGPNNDCIE